ncbi:MAG: 16S rRNA (cytosine(967)-C(5))-methyltransferase RsmB [Desulfobacterales bacterium]|nr:16S rRNA (cytosine(967)-C(5))-methyltransferase RsmB [Desulfobacterales bacterium]
MIPNNSRITALLILDALENGRKTLDAVLEDTNDQINLFTPSDRRLLYSLIYGVLRWRLRLDWILAHFAKKGLKKINPKVLNILRLGLFQIMFLDRIPVSAAVNTSVEMTKLFAAPWVVPFVNAVLRSCARDYQNVASPELNKDPVGALAIEKSFPRWLIKRWLDRFGLLETRQLCDAVNTIAPITVRTNTLKINRDKLMECLQKDFERIEFSNDTSDGIRCFNPKISIPEMKAFKMGWFQVQDEAAQLVTELLNPQPEETILDACAGLGGKTGHMAQLMKNIGMIIAMDKDKGKLLRLEAEMQRLGISIVKPYIHKIDTHIEIGSFKLFDRILVDAPCSGLGVLRRNPDTKWSASEEKLRHYGERQLRFLENLAHRVKPEGVLVYAVCSIEPEENEYVIKTFLNKHSDFVIKKGRDQNRYLRTYPHLHHMDGFFAVCLKRVT